MTPYPCEPVVEVLRAPGDVPHYLPGQNPFIDEFAECARVARRGGARRRADRTAGVRWSAAMSGASDVRLPRRVARRYRWHGSGPACAQLAARACCTTAGDPASPQTRAPLDLTGQWVAIVNEDWRWRMVTPPHGDYASVPLNAEGRRVADLWEPAQDGACEAYGAAGLMRMPTRLRIAWDGDDALEDRDGCGTADAAPYLRRQCRPGRPVAARPVIAEWVRPLPPPGGPGLAGAGGGQRRPGGYLKVTTTNLLPGWLRRNGVPYSEDASLTEYFDRFGRQTATSGSWSRRSSRIRST